MFVAIASFAPSGQLSFSNNMSPRKQFIAIDEYVNMSYPKVLFVSLKYAVWNVWKEGLLDRFKLRCSYIIGFMESLASGH